MLLLLLLSWKSMKQERGGHGMVRVLWLLSSPPDIVVGGEDSGRRDGIVIGLSLEVKEENMVSSAIDGRRRGLRSSELMTDGEFDLDLDLE